MTPERPGPPGGDVLLALDVDGVLLDPRRGGRGPWQTAFGARFGVDAGLLDDTLFAAPWAEVVTGRRPVEAALRDALRQLGWNMDAEAALTCWLEEDFVVDPAVMAAAQAWSAQGIALALVSNQEPRRARFLEQHLAPLLPLAGTAFSGDLGVVKSDPAFYARAEQHLGLHAATSVVFVDDTAANVKAASRHGWAAVHFAAGGGWPDEVAAALDAAAGAAGAA